MTTDMFQGNILEKLDDKYNADYETLSKETKLSTPQIFYIALLVGYINGQRIESNNGNGKEFRPSYFKSDEKGLIYSIALNLEGISPEDLLDDSKYNSIYTILKEYANGGIEYLRNNVFQNNLSENNEIVANKKDIAIKLGRYLSDTLDPNQTPF